MVEGTPLPDRRGDGGTGPENGLENQRAPEAAGPVPQRRGLGRGLAEIIDASATVRVSALLGEQGAPDAHDLQRAGASLAQALLPASTVRWADPSHDRTASTGSVVRIRFDFNDHTRWLLIDRNGPLSTDDVDRLHDVALLLLAALEPTGAITYRIERLTPWRDARPAVTHW